MVVLTLLIQARAICESSQIDDGICDHDCMTSEYDYDSDIGLGNNKSIWFESSDCIDECKETDC